MKKTFALLASVLLASAHWSHATLEGVPQTGTYTTWDTFTAVSFTNATATSSGGSLFTATLTSASAGMLQGDDDRIYGFDFNTFEPGWIDFTINATALSSINTLTLQIKAASSTTFTDINLVGVGAADITTSFLAVDSGNRTLFQWTWTGLNFSASDTFQFTITGPQHSSIDTVSLTDTVHAVPEPSTWVMLLTGVGIVACLKRRRILAHR